VTITATIAVIIAPIMAAVMAAVTAMPFIMTVIPRIIFPARLDDHNRLARPGGHHHSFLTNWRGHNYRRANESLHDAWRRSANDDSFRVRKRKTESEVHTDSCLGCSHCSKKSGCD
jgi:hypothetical protein